jgi:hypothetical protein
MSEGRERRGKRVEDGLVLREIQGAFVLVGVDAGGL